MSLFYNNSLIAKHFNAFITKTIEKKLGKIQKKLSGLQNHNYEAWSLVKTRKKNLQKLWKKIQNK